MHSNFPVPVGITAGYGAASLESTGCLVTVLAPITHSSSCQMTTALALTLTGATSKAPPPSFVQRWCVQLTTGSSAAAAATKASIHATTAAPSVVVCGMRSIEVIGLLSFSSASPSKPQGCIASVPCQ